jgi:hypothetical protein
MPRQVAEGFTDGPTSTAVLRIPQHLPPLWWAPFWLARCAKRCASPSRLQSMTVGLFTVFFCGVTLLRIVNPGLGICQTTKKTLKV